jgi:hypothetical protein
MFELSFGRFVSGALWGVGAGLVLAVLGSRGEGLRPLTKSAVRAYLDVSERVSELTAEARESLEDLYAEAKAEQESEVGGPANEA